MAKKVSENDIQNMSQDWGLDTSNNLPYSGAAVQKFIKETFGSKMGFFYYDTASNRYLCFADEEAKNKYVENPTLTDLVLGSFDAPFNYEASITLLTPTYNAVFMGSTGNYLDFTFDIKNKGGNSTGESVNVTYTFIRNATKKVVTESRRYGETVHVNIDDYLLEGTNTVIVGIQGQTSLAATTASVTYQVVNLSFSDEMNIAKVYDLSKGNQTLEVFFNVSGYGTKIVEWYLDGEQLPFVKAEDEVVDVTSSRTKYVELSNLASGIHTLQSRAYTLVNGEKFYTETLYREIMVTTGGNENMVAVAATLPNSHGLVTGQNPLTLYGAEQYIPYAIRFAARKSGEVTISLDNEALATLVVSAGTESSYQIVSGKAGSLKLSFSTSGIEREIPLSVNRTSLSIEEVTASLSFDFSARGKSNSSIDKDVWSYKNYTGTFTGFNWNASSGWVDNALLINSGASFSVDIAPLMADATTTGKTLEFEFSTKNVEDDNAVVCDLTTNGVGLNITASEARMTSAAGESVSTKFKAGETNRIAFVINRKTSVTYKGLVFIYVNGILSGAVNYGSADNFKSQATLTFQGTDDAQVALRSMRFYDVALTADNILNNYTLYRDTLSEMMEVYYRNDIYEKGSSSFSTDALLHYLPVMVITGDIPTLEAATSTSTQILVDIDYTNEQDSSKNFSMKRAALSIQGTSSLAYPRKNFRFYTTKEESTIVYDASGKAIADKLYSFVDGAQPVDCWCLKADYAESSGTHNTGIARIWNKVMYNAIIQHTNVLGEETNGYALRTQAQKSALEADYKYDVRTTIDGFPIVLFYKAKASDTDLIFLGKYNFNNDKSTPSVFGFENIPNFDNTRMQCWETKDNGHPLGLFTDVSGFDANWSDAYESRYPDTKTPNTADLKAFSEWMNGVSQADFATQKWEHMDVYKVAAYYVYLMRFGAVDQTVKNGFLTSEDGQKFYYINYDNDTINGLINTGELRLEPTINRQTIGTDGEYVYAGHSSVLWNRCEADKEFMDIVSIVDNALYSAGLRYDEVMKVFNDEQCDKWAERVYNQDAEYKYLLPYVNQATNNLFMLQGSRNSHRAWWLSKRFSLYDSLLVSGAYRDRNISFKCLNDTQPNQQFTIKAGTSMNFGYGVNNGIRETGVELGVGESHTFTTTDTLNLGDVVKIFGASDLSELDLSAMAARLAVLDCSAAADNVLGSKMKKLILGGKGIANIELSSVSGINKLASLQEINVEDYRAISSLNLASLKDLRKVYAKGSGVASIDFATGAPVEYLELPSAMMALNLQQLPYLRSENITLEGISNIWKMEIINCPYVSSNFNFVYDWILAKTTADASCHLSMDGIDWQNISGEHMERIASLGYVSLRGKAKLTDVTAEQGELFMRVFGEDVFTEGADFYISAPVSVTIYGEDSILEGDSATYSSKIFPNAEGTITYTLVQSREGLTFDEETGVLTTIENGLDTSSVTIKAVFTPADGEAPSEATKTISIVKRTYPSDLSIEGDVDLKRNQTFSWSSSSDEESVNGEYNVEWLLSGGLASYYSVQNNGGYCVLNQVQTPPTTVTGSLVVNLRKAVDNSIVASASVSVSFAYIYPSSVAVSGKNSIIGGASEVYSATITPSNYDIGVIYTWSVSGSSNVFIESRNGSTCTLGSNTPENEENFTLTCVVKSSDNKISVTNSISCTLQTRVNFITATYNISESDIGHAYSVLYRYYDEEDIEYMEVDGIEVTPSSTYAFQTAGTHTIKYTLRKLFSAFKGLYTLVSVDFSECNGAYYRDSRSSVKEMFYNSPVSSIEWGECIFPYINNADSAFSECKNLASLDLSPFVNCAYMNSICFGCSNLVSVILPSSKEVYSLEKAFTGCALTSIDLNPLRHSTALKSIKGLLSGTNVSSVDLEPLRGKAIYSLQWFCKDCKNLTYIDLTPLADAPITNISSMFYGCENLESFNWEGLNLSGVSTSGMEYTFKGCKKLTHIDLSPLKGANVGTLTDTFYECLKLNTLVSPFEVAPTVTDNTFGGSNDTYTGRTTYGTGENMLIVPINSIGYDKNNWFNVLCNPSKCGFTLRYSYEPLECTGLTITADNASGRATTTTIYWTAITNGVDSLSGETMNNVEIIGTATSEEFPQNTSETENVERTISFTYMGVTATTTIVQGVWVSKEYKIDLNKQWEQSSSISNPDSALYDGVYQSFSNKGKDNTSAICYVDIEGYETFRLYVRSYAESTYDYVMVSQLDEDIDSSTTSSSSVVKAHTSGVQNSQTGLSYYTLVEYTGIDEGAHRITIVYRKDNLQSSNDDRGYFLIPKNQ